jgi:hypothetical protein
MWTQRKGKTIEIEGMDEILFENGTRREKYQ